MQAIVSGWWQGSIGDVPEPDVADGEVVVLLRAVDPPRDIIRRLRRQHVGNGREVLLWDHGRRALM